MQDPVEPKKKQTQEHTADTTNINLGDINNWQRFRALVTAPLIRYQSYNTVDIEMRKKYWKTQTHFLENIYNKSENPANGPSFSSWILGLIVAASNHDKSKIDQFKDAIKTVKNVIKTQANPKSVEKPAEIISPLEFHNADIIDVITQKEDNYHIVVDNAPNSNRDGASKFKKGTVEETMARHTNAWKMILHFRNVHTDNGVPNPSVDVADYQRRYLLMMLNIVYQGGFKLQVQQC